MSAAATVTCSREVTPNNQDNDNRVDTLETDNRNGTPLSISVNSQIPHSTSLPTTEMEKYGILCSINQETTTTFENHDNAVDSALIAALREPRERVALLRLETLLLDFIHSDAGWLEISGPFNSFWIGPLQRLQGNNHNLTSQQMCRPATSFQRCVLHRLADRFGIIRETGSIIEGSIRLMKVPQSKVPVRLLQDLKPLEYSATPPTYYSVQNNDATTTYVSGAVTAAASSPPAVFSSDSKNTYAVDHNSVDFGSSSSSATAPPPTNPQQRLRKMKIMKRSDDRSSRLQQLHTDGGSCSSKTAASATIMELSDKERAYAEARARIFCDEADNNNNSSSDDVLGEDSVVISNTTMRASVSTTPSSSLAVVAAGQADHNLQSPICASKGLNDSPVNTVHNGTTDPAATNNVESKKAVYRNRTEEAADPDFQRGVGIVPMMYPTYHSVSALPAVTQYHPPMTIPYAQSSTLRGYNHVTYPGNHHHASTSTSSTTPYYLQNGNASTMRASRTRSNHSLDSQSISTITTVTPSSTPRSNSSSSAAWSTALAADAPVFVPSWAATSHRSSDVASITSTTRNSSSPLSTTTTAVERLDSFEKCSSPPVTRT